MSQRKSTLSIAAVLAASALVLQTPLAGAAGNAAASNDVASTAQADPRGVPGVEVNLGKNASDRGLPGVEMNIGRQGDQNNLDQNNRNTRTLGAGASTGTGANARSGTSAGMGTGTDARMGTGTNAEMGTGTGTLGAGAGANGEGPMSRPMRTDRG